ncbi:DUF3143 domain-containing protein [Pleurocapsales cyanobacterium LEGE 06147]|nr:DUF3143 domain-containing protein [Pleurocapsales cyanobacterium LEGE 06147]
MSLPDPQTPLYNHPLPKIEQWLTSLGCQQNQEHLHCWHLEKFNWQAEIYLETEELIVCYLGAGERGKDLTRSFKYSLTRQDIEAAVFSGP